MRPRRDELGEINSGGIVESLEALPSSVGVILEAMGRHQQNANEGLTKQIHWEKWAACRHTKEAEGTWTGNSLDRAGAEMERGEA